MMDRKRSYKLLGGLLFLILLVEALVFNRQYLVQTFSGLQQQRLPVSAGVLNQYSYQNDLLIPRGANPRIRFENVGMRITSISIRCQHTLTSSSGRVYYRNNKEPFTDLNSVPFTPRYNGSEIIVSLPNTPFVSDLRITLSDRQGDNLRCSEFVINPYAQLRFTVARITLYLSLMVFAMLQLFQGSQTAHEISQQSWLLSIKQKTGKLARAFEHKGTAILVMVWVLFWLLPWAIWLDTLPWLRCGISLFLFIIPGMILSLLLVGEQFTLLTHFISGLALSVFGVGALGFTGRIFHWPFQYVKILFALSGLIAVLFILRYSVSMRPLYKSSRLSGKTFILLLFMIVFGILANIPFRLSTDDFSFVAYLTNWQHAQQLGFREVFYGTGTANSLRFWLGMFPMSLALLAEISHLHGLLMIGIYLEPFLVMVAIVSIYVLYEDLLSSQDQAIIATLFQFVFLFLLRQVYQPGFMLLTRPSDDKVFAAFILAPVFFLSIRYFLKSFHWRSGLFFLLVGFSLALTHPIILAYSVFIAGLYATIEILIRKKYTKIWTFSFLLILIIGPSASLRFIDDAWVARSILRLEPTVDMQNTFTLNAAREESDTVDTLVTAVEGTPFYGFNLERIQIVLNRIPDNPLLVFSSWSYLWVLGAGFLWSLFNLRKNDAAPFVVAASLLVLLCVIPYTGWLVGYFVSARMLWRSPWLLPIGLISFILLREFFSVLESRVLAHGRFRGRAKNLLYIWIPIACLLLMTGLHEFFFQHQWLQKESLKGYQNSLIALAELGNYLDDNVGEVERFVARPGLMNYLPGLSAKSKVVLFRFKEWAPYPINEGEITSLVSNDPSITMDQRIQILHKYNVQYILVDHSTLKDYYVQNADFFSVQNFDGYWLIKLK